MAEEDVTEEINASSFKLVCQLCDKIFEEDIPIACVHLTFCKKCFEKNGLHGDLGHGMDMVCTRCSGISVNRNQEWNSQQDVLNSMHLRAKCRRGLLGLLENSNNSEVNAICQQIDKKLHITDTGSTSLLSISSLPGSSKGGTKPCLGAGCKTCKMVIDASEVTGPSRETVNVEGNFTCRSKRVIYYIHCVRCNKGYVGKTVQKLQVRISKHCRDIEVSNPSSSVANHFNLSGHNTTEDLRVCVIKSFPPNAKRRKMLKDEKEMMLRIGTLEPDGMNKG